jgi:hypothetical protein
MPFPWTGGNIYVISNDISIHMSGFDSSVFDTELEAATRAKTEKKLRNRIVKKVDEIWCKFSGKRV